MYFIRSHEICFAFLIHWLKKISYVLSPAQACDFELYKSNFSQIRAKLNEMQAFVTYFNSFRGKQSALCLTFYNVNGFAKTFLFQEFISVHFNLLNVRDVRSYLVCSIVNFLFKVQMRSRKYAFVARDVQSAEKWVKALTDCIA